MQPLAKIRDLIADDSGQDVVEYALLGALIGIAAIAIWQQLVDTVGDVYSDADAGVQGIACPPDPGGAPGTCF